VVKVRLIALGVAIAFLAGVIGWRIAQPDHPSEDSADIGFLHDMTTHHEQAIYLSSIELQRGVTPEMQVFAEEIHRWQSYEIGLMERFLDELGSSRYAAPDTAMAWMGHHDMPRDEMPGLATDEEIDGMLAAAGDDVDEWFVGLMVDHHAAGADMADAAAAEVDDDEVRELAERMAHVQRQEIGELLAAAERIGLDVPRPGVIWNVYED
jgi:uncharacterized protein (DUF305 family)